MIDSKKFGIIAVTAVILAVAVTAAMIFFSPSGAYDNTPEYADKIFGGGIISIDISADPDEWQSMLDNAMNEEYIMADVTINGTLFTDVGIRPKGNNSLQTVSSSDSDRYSFKIKFDEYINDQSCYGLDMLVLNNMIGDPTYMKEYTTFDMMKTLGINTPYSGYSDISVNGEEWGLYFTLEAYNDSYISRVSGSKSGALYNVKSVGGMGGERNISENSAENDDDKTFANDGKFSRNDPGSRDFSENSDVGDNDFQENDPGNFRRRPFAGQGDNQNGGMGGRGGMGAGSSGGSLVYTTDDPSDYPAIFENAVGGGTDADDYAKVISALKALNSGENIEEYFDVDEILRYLAVHTFVVNLDSYSSEMAQNYYIYENDGVIQILPWDYNYAWGAFQGGGASATVNFPVDTPVSGVEMSERPLISKLFENEEYFERYHEYLLMLINEYFTGGKFEKLIDTTDLLIGDYVKNDATAFYSYDEYQAALEQFKIIGNLRAESAAGQIAGTVPSTSEEQSSAADKLIDASEINMNVLGSGGGMNGGMGGFWRTDRFMKNNSGINNDNNFPPEIPEDKNFSPEIPDGNNSPPEIPDGKDLPQFPGGGSPLGSPEN